MKTRDSHGGGGGRLRGHLVRAPPTPPATPPEGDQAWLLGYQTPPRSIGHGCQGRPDVGERESPGSKPSSPSAAREPRSALTAGSARRTRGEGPGREAGPESKLCDDTLGLSEPIKHPCLGFLIWKGGQLLPRLGAGGQRFAQRLATEAAGPRPARATGPLTRWTLLSLAPARAAASPDTELSSWLLPWAPPAGRGGGGGGAAPVGGGGTGGGGGGGGPPHERGALAADEGCPGGRTGPETRQGGAVRFRPPAGPPWGRRGSGGLAGRTLAEHASCLAALLPPQPRPPGARGRPLAASLPFLPVLGALLGVGGRRCLRCAH